ncbi:hypothetical protein SNOG_14485 [Parastagonospora nodorum SN15]|uniref:Uncharacterized protein n=1 Tax=Phaeosphaeria nodorum (strain SN15 / ATCC MYA-4574 / FGSC 10173) TaxID=321614 RepID=Q0U0X3_PHANO|nr:hypothetical protein SNOG_14485 [Parastagonospora nodorum SN15]EAT78025.2 hypothetical protein SNOG_14485 [Parastagonospora nodorum SN15]
MALTKLVKMLLAFVLVALAAASNCDPSCRKIVLDCAKAIGPYNAKAIIPVDMSQCLSLLFWKFDVSGAWSWGSAEDAYYECGDGGELECSGEELDAQDHQNSEELDHDLDISTYYGQAFVHQDEEALNWSLMTHSPPPSGPPTPPSKRDDPIHCGFGCNINECALVCMPQSYIDSYKKYPGNQWFDNNGAEVTVTLRSGVWKCNGGGCVRTTQTGECWTWCDQYGLNCQLMCKGKKTMRKRGHCWEMCDPGGLHCSITCNAEKEKRQCREVCDETGKCTSECVDEPKKTCWQACDSQGENCREECSVVGNID